ncbi:MAG TPA: hypothetical protein VOA64_02360 [Candidatus Dormibacteraeota bacterium]|nr:hypothetical protein [Candidatus Dormibacteraeota bacterium]
MTNLGLILVAVTATSLNLHAQTAASDPEVKAVSDSTVWSFVDSWNRADGAAYGENHWPEAALVNPSDEIVDGRTAIAKEHVDHWAGIFKGSRRAAQVRKIPTTSSLTSIPSFPNSRRDAKTRATTCLRLI